MPKLPTYTAELQGALQISGGRRAGGEDFGAEGGAALTQAGRTLATEAERALVDIEQQDQRRMLVGHSELRAKYTKELQDAELSGADLDPIRQKFENEANALRGNTSTVAGAAAADVHTQNSMAVFDTRSAQIRVERAGAEARTGGSKLLSSNASILMTNPAYLPVALAEADAYADTFAGKLPPHQIAEMKRGLREHLTVATVSGEIMTGDPKAIREKLVGGEWPEIGPEARTALLGRATAQERTNRSEEESNARFKAWEANEASRLAKDEHFKAIIAGQFKPNAALQDPRLTPEHREHLMVFNDSWWKAKLGQEKVSDQRVVKDLMLRIYAREGDPKRIINDDLVYEALKNGQINNTDFNKLRVMVAELRDNQNAPIGRTLSRSLGVMQRLYSGPVWIGREHVAASIVNSWFYDVNDRVDAARKANDTKMLDDMFNPKSSNYIMAPEYLAGFVRGATSGSAPVGGGPAVGTEMQFPDGTTRKFKGGDPASTDSWDLTKDPTPSQLILPTSGLTIKWTGKGDKNDMANWEPTEKFKTSGHGISEATATYNQWQEEGRIQRAKFFNSLLGGE